MYIDTGMGESFGSGLALTNTSPQAVQVATSQSWVDKIAALARAGTDSFNSVWRSVQGPYGVPYDEYVLTNLAVQQRQGLTMPSTSILYIGLAAVGLVFLAMFLRR